MTALQTYTAYQVISDYDDVRRVAAFAGRMGEIAAAGRGTRGAIVAQIAVESGVSASTVRRMFDKWRVGGDVALADRRKIRTGEDENPYYATFMDFARRNKNDCKSAYRDMMRELRSGREFEFGTWRTCWMRDFPYEAVPRFAPRTIRRRGWRTIR